MMPTSFPAPWHRSGSAAIEHQALVLALDQGDTSVVQPGVRLWRASALDAELAAVASSSPADTVAAGAIGDKLLALIPDGDYRATDRVRLGAVDLSAADWTFRFDVLRGFDPDGDPAPARVCVLLQVVADGQVPRSLRFDFDLRASSALPGAPQAVQRCVSSLGLRLT